jgi:hypothetical protein
MPTHRIPHNILAFATASSHALMIGGAIALYLTGRISTTAFAAIMAAFGAGWSGVAGTLISTRSVTPSTAPGGSASAPGASVTPDNPATGRSAP